jgi:hypothetical protein
MKCDFHVIFLMISSNENGFDGASCSNFLVLAPFDLFYSHFFFFAIVAALVFQLYLKSYKNQTEMRDWVDMCLAIVHNNGRVSPLGNHHGACTFGIGLKKIISYGA